MPETEIPQSVFDMPELDKFLAGGFKSSPLLGPRMGPTTVPPTGSRELELSFKPQEVTPMPPTEAQHGNIMSKFAHDIWTGVKQGVFSEADTLDNIVNAIAGKTGKDRTEIAAAVVDAIIDRPTEADIHKGLLSLVGRGLGQALPIIAEFIAGTKGVGAAMKAMKLPQAVKLGARVGAKPAMEIAEVAGRPAAKQALEMLGEPTMEAAVKGARWLGPGMASELKKQGTKGIIGLAAPAYFGGRESIGTAAEGIVNEEPALSVLGRSLAAGVKGATVGGLLEASHMLPGGALTRAPAMGSVFAGQTAIEPGATAQDVLASGIVGMALAAPELAGQGIGFAKRKLRGAPHAGPEAQTIVTKNNKGETVEIYPQALQALRESVKRRRPDIANVENLGFDELQNIMFEEAEVGLDNKASMVYGKQQQTSENNVTVKNVANAAAAQGKTTSSQFKPEFEQLKKDLVEIGKAKALDRDADGNFIVQSEMLHQLALAKGIDLTQDPQIVLDLIDFVEEPVGGKRAKPLKFIVVPSNPKVESGGAGLNPKKYEVPGLSVVMEGGEVKVEKTGVELTPEQRVAKMEAELAEMKAKLNDPNTPESQKTTARTVIEALEKDIADSRAAANSTQEAANKRLQELEPSKFESAFNQTGGKLAEATFTPTAEWQEVPADAVLPPGLEIRMDMATGKNFARLKGVEMSVPEGTVLTETAEKVGAEYTKEKIASDIKEARKLFTEIKNLKAKILKVKARADKIADLTKKEPLTNDLKSKRYELSEKSRRLEELKSRFHGFIGWTGPGGLPKDLDGMDAEQQLARTIDAVKYKQIREAAKAPKKTKVEPLASEEDVAMQTEIAKAEIEAIQHDLARLRKAKAMNPTNPDIDIEIQSRQADLEMIGQDLARLSQGKMPKMGKVRMVKSHAELKQGIRKGEKERIELERKQKEAEEAMTGAKAEVPAEELVISEAEARKAAGVGEGAEPTKEQQDLIDAMMKPPLKGGSAGAAELDPEALRQQLIAGLEQAQAEKAGAKTAKPLAEETKQPEAEGVTEVAPAEAPYPYVTNRVVLERDMLANGFRKIGDVKTPAGRVIAFSDAPAYSPDVMKKMLASPQGKRWRWIGVNMDDGSWEIRNRSTGEVVNSSIQSGTPLGELPNILKAWKRPASDIEKGTTSVTGEPIKHFDPKTGAYFTNRADAAKRAQQLAKLGKKVGIKSIDIPRDPRVYRDKPSVGWYVEEIPTGTPGGVALEKIMAPEKKEHIKSTVTLTLETPNGTVTMEVASKDAEAIAKVLGATVSEADKKTVAAAKAQAVVKEKGISKRGQEAFEAITGKKEAPTPEITVDSLHQARVAIEQEITNKTSLYQKQGLDLNTAAARAGKEFRPLLENLASDKPDPKIVSEWAPKYMARSETTGELIAPVKDVTKEYVERQPKPVEATGEQPKGILEAKKEATTPAPAKTETKAKPAPVGAKAADIGAPKRSMKTAEDKAAEQLEVRKQKRIEQIRAFAKDTKIEDRQKLVNALSKPGALFWNPDKAEIEAIADDILGMKKIEPGKGGTIGSEQLDPEAIRRQIEEGERQKEIEAKKAEARTPEGQEKMATPQGVKELPVEDVNGMVKQALAVSTTLNQRMSDLDKVMTSTKNKLEALLSERRAILTDKEKMPAGMAGQFDARLAEVDVQLRNVMRTQTANMDAFRALQIAAQVPAGEGIPKHEGDINITGPDGTPFNASVISVGHDNGKVYYIVQAEDSGIADVLQNNHVSGKAWLKLATEKDKSIYRLSGWNADHLPEEAQDMLLNNIIEGSLVGKEPRRVARKTGVASGAWDRRQDIDNKNRIMARLRYKNEIEEIKWRTEEGRFLDVEGIDITSIMQNADSPATIEKLINEAADAAAAKGREWTPKQKAEYLEAALRLNDSIDQSLQAIDYQDVAYQQKGADMVPILDKYADPSKVKHPTVRRIGIYGQQLELGYRHALLHYMKMADISLGWLRDNPEKSKELMQHVWKIKESTDPDVIKAAEAHKTLMTDLRNRFSKWLPTPKNTREYGEMEDYMTKTYDPQLMWDFFKKPLLEAEHYTELPDNTQSKISYNDFHLVKDLARKYANTPWEKIPGRDKTYLTDHYLKFMGAYTEWSYLPKDLQQLIPEKKWVAFFQPRTAKDRLEFALKTDYWEVLQSYLAVTLRGALYSEFLAKTEPLMRTLPHKGTKGTWGHLASEYVKNLGGYGDKSWSDRKWNSIAEQINTSFSRFQVPMYVPAEFADWYRESLYRGALGPDTALRNLTQTMFTWAEDGTMPVLKGLVNYIYGRATNSKEYKKFKDTYDLMDEFWSEEMRTMSKYNPSLYRKLKSMNHRITHLVLTPLRFTEQFNKGVAYFSGLEAARRKGVDFQTAHLIGLNMASQVVPNFEFSEGQWRALQSMGKSQFQYGQSTTSPYLKGTGISLLTPFWSFPVKTAQFIRNGITEGYMAKDWAKMARFITLTGFLVGSPMLLAETLGIDAFAVWGKGALPISMFPLWYNTINDIWTATGGEADPMTKKLAGKRGVEQLWLMAMPQYRWLKKTGAPYEMGMTDIKGSWQRLDDKVTRWGTTEAPLTSTNWWKELLYVFGWPTMDRREGREWIREAKGEAADYHYEKQKYVQKIAEFQREGKGKAAANAMRMAQAQGIEIRGSDISQHIRNMEIDAYTQQAKRMPKPMKADWMKRAEEMRKKQLRGNRSMWGGEREED